MEAFPRTQRADQNSPLSNAIPPLHQIAPIKKIIFLPQIFLPTLTALERDDPSSPLFIDLPPPNPCPSVRAKRICAYLCSNHSCHHPSTPYRHQVRTEGQKDLGQKNGDRIQRADQNSPRSSTIPPLHQIVTVKKIIFLPQIFLPTLPTLGRDDPSSPFFINLPPAQSVPICGSEANLCPPGFQSFTPSPVNARIGVR
jgi:hypothetical protein